MSLLLEIARDLAESVRSTLPDSTETAGAFVSGMCYAFVIFWAVLILVTWAYVRAALGGR